MVAPAAPAAQVGHSGRVQSRTSVRIRLRIAHHSAPQTLLSRRVMRASPVMPGRSATVPARRTRVSTIPSGVAEGATLETVASIRTPGSAWAISLARCPSRASEAPAPSNAMRASTRSPVSWSRVSPSEMVRPSSVSGRGEADHSGDGRPDHQRAHPLPHSGESRTLGLSLSRRFVRPYPRHPGPGPRGEQSQRIHRRARSPRPPARARGCGSTSAMLPGSTRLPSRTITSTTTPLSGATSASRGRRTRR